MNGNERDTSRRGDPRSRKRGGIPAGVLVLLLAAVPALGGEKGKGSVSPGEHAPGRQVRLALRIAEAKNRVEARRYYRSLARRQKLAAIRLSVVGRKKDASGGKNRAGGGSRSGGGPRKRKESRRRE